MSLEQMITSTTLGGHFHAYWTINENAPSPGDVIGTNLLTQVLTISPPTGGNVFPQTTTILELIKDIIRRHKLSPISGGHVFQQTGTIFELVLDILGSNLLTMFHEDRAIHVASREIITIIIISEMYLQPRFTVYNHIGPSLGENAIRASLSDTVPVIFFLNLIEAAVAFEGITMLNPNRRQLERLGATETNMQTEPRQQFYRYNFLQSPFERTTKNCVRMPNDDDDDHHHNDDDDNAAADDADADDDDNAHAAADADDDADYVQYHELTAKH
ncbi:hypothetical protein DPMN_184281 [Dreissena polymorpha]|uniref:Uncharacterized protein n=1 Tax=Dreissena polymorpha TaxID=45954 RepID=A0A9D4I777_DREPO|nr:hypothetical protein DPMN_184281 [Dreissena polymorpha]